MPSISETAYPRYKSNFTQKELNDIYTPSQNEVDFAVRVTKGDMADRKSTRLNSSH